MIETKLICSPSLAFFSLIFRVAGAYERFLALECPPTSESDQHHSSSSNNESKEWLPNGDTCKTTAPAQQNSILVSLTITQQQMEITFAANNANGMGDAMSSPVDKVSQPGSANEDCAMDASYELPSVAIVKQEKCENIVERNAPEPNMDQIEVTELALVNNHEARMLGETAAAKDALQSENLPSANDFRPNDMSIAHKMPSGKQNATLDQTPKSWSCSNGSNNTKKRRCEIMDVDAKNTEILDIQIDACSIYPATTKKPTKRKHQDESDRTEISIKLGSPHHQRKSNFLCAKRQNYDFREIYLKNESPLQRYLAISPLKRYINQSIGEKGSPTCKNHLRSFERKKSAHRAINVNMMAWMKNLLKFNKMHQR